MTRAGGQNALYCYYYRVCRKFCRKQHIKKIVKLSKNIQTTKLSGIPVLHFLLASHMRIADRVTYARVHGLEREKYIYWPFLLTCTGKALMRTVSKLGIFHKQNKRCFWPILSEQKIWDKMPVVDFLTFWKKTQVTNQSGKSENAT